MQELPSPPVPEGTDLRHMPGYMIDVQALLDSELAAFGDPAANWYALLTWCASFHQVPAGSLPDDDAVLAYLVRLGRDVRTWKKMREKGAMKGWIKHSDGRLYHPIVTETVLTLMGKVKAGKTAAAAKKARREAQVIENAASDTNDRSTIDARSLQHEADNRTERKGIEGKGRESILGQAEETGGDVLGGRDLMPVIPQPDYAAMFRQWYAVYPKHVDPKDAEQKFIRVLKKGEATFEELIVGAQRYADECAMNRTEKKYIKAPAVFLNKGSWKNEAGANSTGSGLSRRSESFMEGILAHRTVGGDHEN